MGNEAREFERKTGANQPHSGQKRDDRAGARPRLRKTEFVKQSNYARVRVSFSPPTREEERVRERDSLWERR